MKLHDAVKILRRELPKPTAEAVAAELLRAAQAFHVRMAGKGNPLIEITPAAIAVRAHEIERALKQVHPKARAEAIGADLHRRAQRMIGKGIPSAIAAQAHAVAVARKLADLLERFRSLSTIQKAARNEAGALRRGRPRDLAEIDLEARVLQAFEHHGLKVSDTTASPAMKILSLLGEARAHARADPRDVLRRARRRQKSHL